MRVRSTMLIPFLLATGCQDKKPEQSGRAVEVVTTSAPAASEATRAGAAPTIVPAATPLSGSLSGKPFRPEKIGFDGIAAGTIVTIAAGDDMLQIFIPGPEGEKLEGKELSLGGKPEDAPITWLRLSKNEHEDIADYSMKLKINKQSRSALEGHLELTIKKPADTELRGNFTATYQRSPTAPLGPEDAPCVHGKITIKDVKPTEQLAAGFVGIAANGNPCSNEAGFPLDTMHDGYSRLDGNVAGQTSILANTAKVISYRHLNMPPGDYIVYVRRDGLMAAWKRIKLKEGELPALNLTIDPAATGEVVVTFPDAAAESSLALVPPKADLPDLGVGSEHYFKVATVKAGEKTIKVQGVPAGKYRAIRGTDEADVEVVAGKSVAVTLVPAKK
jgi:hypothetical protein